MMKKALLSLLVPTLAFAGDAAKPAPAAAPPAQPAPPADVKTTVDMFKGNWSFDSTINATGVPGMDKPVKFKMAFPCKTVADGNAVECTASAKTAMGPFDGTFLVAYDPYSKAVHFISVTNMFEVHDHVCQWKGGDLSCTPLKAGMGAGGDEITEDITMHFDKNTCDFTSVSHMKGGATMTFAGKGKK
jgi:hypothetical protein